VASLLVNGTTRELASPAGRPLLAVLREELGLLAAKPGCGEGACGACTVLVGGEATRSCVLPVGEVGDRPVTTLEGLTGVGRLHAVQQAFVEVGALQCGYCTAGMIMSAAALLAAIPDPDESQIVAAMDGNVCRCCTYPRIVRAIRRAVELLDKPASPAPELPPGMELARPARPWDLVAAADRDWFAALPHGLVVAVESDRAAGVWTTSAGAWLHVSPDGAVTAFTGKVDVGQDNTTALSLLVAAELDVPVASVRLVMGDTDVCPYDEGTFGSRSMADAGPLLQTAAAAAHRSLTRRPLEPDEQRIEVVSGGPAVGGRRRRPVNGETIVRPRSLAAATGALRYPSDLSRPGMLRGTVLHPPTPGSRLRKLNAEAARAIADVTVVHEGDFVGVTATTEEDAARALDAVDAAWDTPAGPDDGQLAEYLRSHPVELEGWAGAYHHVSGDVDTALATADVRLEATYTTGYVAHVPLETRAAVAEWTDGRLTVWTGTQRPFGVRAELAAHFGLAEEHVRVVAPTAGAGFGGKHSADVAIEAARLARACGHPVKVRWTREQEFAAAYLRPAAVIDVRSGARTDGTIVAWDFLNINSGAAGIACPYAIPDQRLAFQPADSPLRQGSYRALAATANHFARESHIDELAHRLGVDPVDLRLRHLDDARLADVLRSAAERAGWGARGHQDRVGLGIACGIEKDARVATCAEVTIDEAERTRVTRIITAFDCGLIVDRDNLMNQIEGATVMGLGGALHEQIHLRDGSVANSSLSHYGVPRFRDVPRIEIVLLDRPDIPSAGAGETPIVCVAPAIANAIYAATGTRRRALPLDPD